MWQEIAISIIGVVTAGYVARKLWRLFRPAKQDPFCAGCNAHCPQKEYAKPPTVDDKKKKAER
ncbi:MAG: FeoB-associated Cys-rich membrane protein [Tannerella sp.]|jgi:hypothetical protein|nr:FeoB-associated Cys-rich membrane protein [Tannerella sp.]